MINRIDPNKPIVSKDKLKQWLQAAKQTKSVVRLYKIDKLESGFKGVMDITPKLWKNQE
jgi:hypothetical protein